MRELRELALIDLNLLPKFRALYRRRSVSAAAHDLHLTQSAVSNALAKMRSLFGDELFVRTSAGMEPTTLACALAEPVERALAAVEGALHDLSLFSPGESVRRFTLSVSPLAEAWLMPHLLAISELEAPNVSVVVRQITDVETEHCALEGLCDFAIGVGRAEASPPQAERLSAHPLAYMARAGNPFFDSPLPRSLVKETESSLGSVPAQLFSYADRRTPRASRAEDAPFSSTSVLALPYIVEHTSLVAAVPAWFAARCSKSFRISWARVPGHATVDMLLFSSARQGSDSGLAWMREAIVRAARLADGPPNERRLGGDESLRVDEGDARISA